MRHKHFIRGVDGFYVFWPEASDGAFTAHDLRRLAAELDAVNLDSEATLLGLFQSGGDGQPLKEK